MHKVINANSNGMNGQQEAMYQLYITGIKICNLCTKMMKTTIGLSQVKNCQCYVNRINWHQFLTDTLT